MIRPSTTQYGLTTSWREPRGKHAPQLKRALTWADLSCFTCTLPAVQCAGGESVGPCAWREAKAAERLIKVFCEGMEV